MKFSSYSCLYLLGIILISCSGPKKPKPDPTLPPKYAITTEPQFNYQGDLWFLSPQADSLKSIHIEIADTYKKQEQGLMYRKSMQEHQGMLFIFDEERRQSFWMKDTPLSLDIIFVNAEKEIVHIAENTQPYSLRGIPSFEYAQYVVEVNAGFCKKFAIQVGQTIEYAKR